MPKKLNKPIVKNIHRPSTPVINIVCIAIIITILAYYCSMSNYCIEFMNKLKNDKQSFWYL